MRGLSSVVNAPAAAAKSLQLCPTLRPQRWQPTRLPRPWDSPGKNTGVGCHFLLQRMKVKSESEVVQLCPTLSDPMDCCLPHPQILALPQESTTYGWMPLLTWGLLPCVSLWSHSHLINTRIPVIGFRTHPNPV